MFTSAKPVVGMVHVPALPGSPLCRMSFEEIRAFVAADASALADGGVDGIIIENFGDVPFYPSRVPPHTVAFLTALALKVKRRTALPLGINVLRNDGMSAMGIAAAAGADFIRVNVYTGARVADQGILQGEAHEIARYRSALGIATQIWADVAVKHSAPLGAKSLEDETEDTVRRGLADAVIVSGTATGKPASIEDTRAVKACAAPVPVYVGSGVNEASVASLLEVADGVIVGTALKFGGDVAAAVDVARVRSLMRAARKSR